MRKIALLVLLCLVFGCFSACGDDPEATQTEGTEQTEPSEQDTESTASDVVETVDYAASVTLDMDSPTAKQEVTVKQFVDGDTTHFYVPEFIRAGGVLKARYLGINTPESTGTIEEYGKKASAFTREKLADAVSIIIESEDGNWNLDSTGDRHLVWVWYKTADSEAYRNLNVEILQNGLAVASNSAQYRYGDACMAAFNQAKAQKLNVHSGQRDPDFYYGEAVELTLRELRTNIEAYSGMKVAFNGVITMNSNNSVFVESYDPETDMYYGISVFYGYNMNGQGLGILSVGNEVRIVGSVQYYEAGGTWQVSDLNYRMMKPDDPGNIQKISEGHSPAYVELDPRMFDEGRVDVVVNDELLTFDYAQLIMSTSVELKGLYIYDGYTTSKEDSVSKGAFTLYGEVDNCRIAVRTIVLYDENGNLITMDQYLGKTINVRGIVDYYDGNYQIKVFNVNDITIVD